VLGLAFFTALVYLAFNRPAASNGEGASQSAEAANAQTERTALMQDLIAQTRHFKGDPDAPVTILEYSDFQ